MRSAADTNLLNFSNESLEMLLLICVFGNDQSRKAALLELKRRQAMHAGSEEEDIFTTNLSGIC
jgi:hypothetical protein